MLCEDTHGNKFLVKAINNCDRPWNSEEVNMWFFFHIRVAIFITIRKQHGKQEMAQWWEHLPPTNVAHAGSNPGINAILIYRVEFVVGSLLCSERFSPGTHVFLSSQTQTFPSSYSTRNQGDEEPLCRCATSKSLLLFIIIFWAVNVLVPKPRGLSSALALSTSSWTCFLVVQKISSLPQLIVHTSLEPWGVCYDWPVIQGFQ